MSIVLPSQCANKANSSTSLRASIVGINGVGKSTVLRKVVDKLSNDYMVLKTGPNLPVYATHNHQNEYSFKWILTAIGFLRALSKRLGLTSLTQKLSNYKSTFIHMVVEPKLAKKFNPEVILGERDFIIDCASSPEIFSEAHKDLDIEDRLASLLREMKGHNLPNIIFFLTAPPSVAAERIQGRFQVTGKEIRRHDNASSLLLMHLKYYQTITAISNAYKARIFILDSSKISPDEIVDQITGIIKLYVEHGPPCEVDEPHYMDRNPDRMQMLDEFQ